MAHLGHYYLTCSAVSERVSLRRLRREGGRVPVSRGDVSAAVDEQAAGVHMPVLRGPMERQASATRAKTVRQSWMTEAAGQRTGSPSDQMHARGARHEAAADVLSHAALRSIKYVTVGVDVTGGLCLTNREGVSGERESAAGCSWLSRCSYEVVTQNGFNAPPPPLTPAPGLMMRLRRSEAQRVKT
jgi:hypothetical protein